MGKGKKEGGKQPARSPGDTCPQSFYFLCPLTLALSMCLLGLCSQASPKFLQGCHLYGGDS